jgi:superfamily II helicase
MADVIVINEPISELKFLEKFETIKGCGKNCVYKFFIPNSSESYGNSIIYTDCKEFQMKQNLKVHTEKYPNEWFLLKDVSFSLDSGESSDIVIDFDEELDKNRSKYRNIYFYWKSQEGDDSDIEDFNFDDYDSY